MLEKSLKIVAVLLLLNLGFIAGVGATLHMLSAPDTLPPISSYSEALQHLNPEEIDALTSGDFTIYIHHDPSYVNGVRYAGHYRPGERRIDLHPPTDPAAEATVLYHELGHLMSDYRQLGLCEEEREFWADAYADGRTPGTESYPATTLVQVVVGLE